MNNLKILLFDIETAPNISYTWGKWQQDVIRFEKEWYVLCFAYKWLGEKKITVVGQDDFKGYEKDKTNDYHVIKELHKLFSEADVVMGHNSDQFDNKKVQARMIQHGLLPPTPYKTIDTKKVAKRYFAFNSNKLDDLGKNLGVGQKLNTGGFELWLGCMAGDRKSWAKMKKYNKQDVALLEEVYLRLRPWIDNHPADLFKPDTCPKCGLGPLHSNGFKVTKTTRYRQFQCQNCGGYCSERKADKTIERPQYV